MYKNKHPQLTLINSQRLTNGRLQNGNKLTINCLLQNMSRDIKIYIEEQMVHMHMATENMVYYIK